MGQKASAFFIFERPQSFGLRMGTEIKAGCILQDQDERMTLETVSGGPTLRADNSVAIAARIFEKGVGGFGRGPIATKFRNGGSWVLTKIANDFLKSFF